MKFSIYNRKEKAHYSLEINSENPITVNDLKAKIFEQYKISIEDQKILNINDLSQELDDNHTFEGEFVYASLVMKPEPKETDNLIPNSIFVKKKNYENNFINNLICCLKPN